MPQAQPKLAQLETKAPTAHSRHPEGAKYWFQCPLCRLQDKTRSAPETRQLSPDDFERTTFLVPSSDFDRKICEAYVHAKYGDVPYFTDSLNLDMLSGWAADEQIVCLRRDTWPRYPAKGAIRQKDEEGKFETMMLPPENFVADIVEMAAINVRDTISMDKATRFAKARISNDALIERLSEFFPIPYRVDMPRHKNDVILRIIHA